MRFLIVTVGVISTILGFVGAFLPLLPTTPFLLLAVYCFARSSDRFHNWLVKTKIYQSYVQDFYERGGYTLKKKFQLLLSVFIVVGFSIFMIDNLYVRIGLAIMVMIQAIVLFTVIKTLDE
ncbi:YbaN family protein [Macrococcus sp. EM39E]|uniref:YbaN family protein n=1 Tax=Macrococcus animalis TaxID=3395467 RepID=UPI0039BDC345